MITNLKWALRLLPAAALAFATLGLPAFAGAQPAPPYAVARQDTIRGTVSHFDGAYIMYVNDSRGYMDRVSLHPGTIINPTGLRLETGDPVTIMGYPSGNTFVADEIDTPYHYAYRYYGPAYYQPAIGLGFGFGGYPYYGRGWGGYRWR